MFVRDSVVVGGWGDEVDLCVAGKNAWDWNGDHGHFGSTFSMSSITHLERFIKAIYLDSKHLRWFPMDDSHVLS